MGLYPVAALFFSFGRWTLCRVLQQGVLAFSGLRQVSACPKVKGPQNATQRRSEACRI